jgi:hemerythrin superfamily protein
MATMINTGIDVVAFLKEQHQHIKQLFGAVAMSMGEERETAFVALRRLLAVHETAEEEIVHPAARKALPQGDDIIAARLDEENEAKTLLAQLEDLDIDSNEFSAKLTMLERVVLAHASAEERLEFEQLGNILDQKQLRNMRRAAEFAEKVAPTHPHPGIESATGNMLAGPFAAMLDRTRDLFTGKS